MRRGILSITLTASLLTAACIGGGQPSSTTPSLTAPGLQLGSPPTVVLVGRATFFAADPGDSAGAAAVGDFNGDGVADLILAAGLADGPSNSRVDAGEAYLFLGPFQMGETMDAAAGEYDAIIYGADAGDELGRALAAGDVNGDGVADIILGAPFADGPGNARRDAGEVYVVFGSPGLSSDRTAIDLATQQPDITVFGADPQDLAGFALAAADLGGDSSDDLIIGAFWADGLDNVRSNAGEVYVIFDARPGRIDLAHPPASMTTVYGAQSEDQLGKSLATGDLNGDGRQDLIAVASFADGPDNTRKDAGEVYVIITLPPGTVDIAAGEQDITIIGVDPGDQIGHSLATGDVTGDGVASLLLGALSSEGFENSLDLAGEVYLFTGDPSLPALVDAAQGPAALTIYGSNATDRLGRSVTMGDLNGDGKADLLLAAPGADGEDESKENAGEVYLLYGRASYDPSDRMTQQADLIVEGLDIEDILGHDAFGTRPLLAVPIDSDPLAEVIVTAPRGDGPDNQREDAGEAYILFFRLE